MIKWRGGLGMAKKRIVIGISGASGAPLAIETLQMLQKQTDWETHLVMSRGAERTIHMEMPLTPDEVCAMADVCYDNEDIGAAIASGTFRTEGMLIVPCSMKTVGGLASGYSDSLLLRAADVTLKERRRLVIAARETPVHAIHLQNLLTLAQAGVTVVPPMVSYYQKPQSIQEMTYHIVCKLLDQFGIECENFARWGE